MRLLSIGLLVAALVAGVQTAAHATQTHYPANPNGYRIYLSPSSQTGNIGCDGYNEATFARRTAERMTLQSSSGFLARGY